MTLKHGERVKMDNWITGNEGEDQFHNREDEPDDFGLCLVSDCSFQAVDDDGFCEEHQGEHSYRCDFCGDWFDSCYIGGLYAEDEYGRDLKKACSACHGILQEDKAIDARRRRLIFIMDVVTVLLFFIIGFIMFLVAGVWDG